MQDKWRNVRMNIIRICQEKELSDEFVWFNDDFILTRPVDDWRAFTNMHVGTLKERAERFRQSEPSRWRHGFAFNNNLLEGMGVQDPLDFEYHGPILYNKSRLLEMYERPEINTYLGVSDVLLFTRSLYGNLYPREIPGRQIRDVKLLADMDDESILTEYGFFSVADGLIGYPGKAPKLNGWLLENLGTKSRYEK